MNNRNNDINLKDRTYLATLLDYFLQYWKLFALSIICCFAVAIVYLKYSPRSYSVNAKVLLKDEKKGTFNSQTDLLADFGYQPTNSSMENEIEVLGSKSVVLAAVKRAGLYIKYVSNGLFIDKPISKADSKINAAMEDKFLDALLSDVNIRLELDEDSLYMMSYNYYDEKTKEVKESEPVKIKTYPYALTTEVGEILLEENPTGVPFKEITISIYNPLYMASYYQGSMAIAPVSKTASVAIISVIDNVTENGIDFINSLISSYNILTNEDKNIVAQKTEEFIGARIKIIGEDLRAQEKNLASYKKDNRFINPTADVTRLLENENNYTKQLQDINIQLQQVDYLLKYLKDKKNDKQAIPTIVGLSSESALTSSITRYNLEVAKRNQLLTTATEENPLILSANSKIEAAQKDIIEVLETLYSSINMRKSALEGVSGEFTQRASQTPAVERIYADLTRERDIKSQLYVMLLQKYEENALALAVTADNLKCIEKASTGGLVSPNRKMAYMLALFFGILFPIAFIYLTETLETKVKRLEDIEKTNKLPIVGCIPELASLKKSNKRHLVVKEGENDIMAEAFRSIRTNLHFLIQKNSGSVVMFTSSTSGEGKTFVSSNYAMSLAVMGKKVLYMGLDIRRPRLAEVFGFDPNKEGITSFLASDGSDLSMLDSYIQPSGVNNNLYLLTAGVIPPNPAELLAKDTLDKAIAYLSGKFDYLVLDTAPIGLVSDSLILSRVADAVVYVVRIKYSQKADLDYLERITSEGKLKNTSLVVNADDMNASGARYGSRYHRYGSSYYGYGYSPDSSRKPK